MFNYTHAVVCNTAAEIENAVKYLVDAAGAKLATVKGVYVEKGDAGTPGSATLVAPADAPVASDKILRAFVKITSERELSDYGLANWQEFARGVMVEGTDLAAVCKNLDLAVASMDEKPFKTDEASKIELCDARLNIEASVEAVGLDANGKEVTSAEVKEATIVKSVAPLYDYEYMAANVQFPTYYNLRANRVGGAKIVEGAVYDCYTVTLAAKRPGLGGLSGVGQEMAAKTKAVFYVKNDVTLANEASIVLGGATVITDANAVAQEAADAAIVA